MSEIARQIDAEEKAMLDPNPFAVESHNVGMDGNYGIQVLIKSLQGIGQYSAENILSESVKGSDLTKE
jgi:hypothetical protein